MAKPLSPAQDERILDLLKAGLSNVSIASICGVDHETVARRRFRFAGLLKSQRPKSREWLRFQVAQAKQLTCVTGDCPCTSSGQ